VVAAAETGKVGQPKKRPVHVTRSMKHAALKVTDSGNEQVMITDRGTMFWVSGL
jgi:2-dehydro-3-deoxyphosphooctonate aldolase (KDO 8-P synthase)